MRLVAAVLLAIAAAPTGGAWGQQPGVSPGSARTCSYRSLESGGVTGGTGEVVNLQGPFRVTCTDGTAVQASSGVVDQGTRIVTLIGSVVFDDPTRSLTSDRAVYDINAGRLHATGNVVFVDRVEGTTLRGPELEYFRVIEGRPEPLVNAYGRPHLTLQRRRAADAAPADSASAPLEIDADLMTITGQDNLTAAGNVLIQDAKMRAVADEAEQRGVAETLELRGNAAIHSEEYSLTGQTIFARIPGGSLQEVEARGEAELLGEELNVRAPQLDLLFENDLLQRSVARRDTISAPGRRPIAESPTFRLQADSIEARLPGQQLQMVVAIGNARGESIDTTGAAPRDSAAPDSAAGPVPQPGDPAILAAADSLEGLDDGERPLPATAAELVANDWIVGDTITGYFAMAAAQPDSAAADSVAGGAEAGAAEPAAEGDAPAAADSTVVLERLVAVGAARSLYHVAPQAGSPPGTQPGINFLSAALIELTFRNGQVDVADVEGLRRGLYLEPLGIEQQPAGDEEAAEDAAGGEGEQGPGEESDEAAGAEATEAVPGTEPGGIE